MTPTLITFSSTLGRAQPARMEGARAAAHEAPESLRKSRLEMVCAIASAF